jgi:uncharacterized membrane protein HdeD (DUF308 family)
MTMRARLAAGTAEATGYWWVLLVSGVLWVLLSLAILQFNLTSVWSIAILTGVVLCVAGSGEFAIAMVAPRWRVAHGLLGAVFVVGGIMAFVWPESTFIVLARLIGWYLIFLGAFEIADSLTFRGDLWWLRLLAGITSIAIAFWAVQSLTRSAALLVLWVGLGALMRGFSQMFAALEWRRIHEDAKQIAVPPPSAPTDAQVDLTAGTRSSRLA